MRIDGVQVARGEAAPSPQLREACQEFEALLLAQLLKQMRATAAAWREGEEDSLAAGIFGEWQDQVLATQMTKGGGIGLAELLYRQLQRQQMEG